MSDLSELQRWLYQAISSPHDLASASRAAGAPASQVVASRRGVPAEARLGVYASGYYARLLDCLRADFPVLCATVGPAVFEGFARGFLIQRPPTSYTLFDLGEGFAEFLRQSRPAAPGGALQDLISLPGELAMLERAVTRCRRSQGVEREADACLTLGAGPLPDIPLSLAPNLALLELSLPLAAPFVRARDTGEGLDPAWVPTAQSNVVGISRWEWQVQVRELEGWQAGLLRALGRGLRLRAAEAAAAESGGVTASFVRARAPVWLGSVSLRGYLNPPDWSRAQAP